MKRSIGMLFLLTTLFLACSSNQKNTVDYTGYVDPFIGTGGHGHTYPGAVVPFGMVQLSPDTRMENWDGSSGYHYSDSTIMGFSHTHLSGTGAPEYCDVLFMPTIGKVNVLVGDEENSKTGYRSAFSHDNETASPGYYSVKLDDYNIFAELTATKRTGLHRYTFPQSDSANIIIDLKNRDRVIASSIQIISDTEIAGMRRSIRWVEDQHVYFYAKFSKPFKSFGIAVNDSLVPNIKKAEGENIKAFISYTTDNNEQILAKVGISAVSIEGAKKNLTKENKKWDFENIRKNAKDAWKQHLAKIDVQGGTEKQKRIFYTALYHSALAPNLFMDVDGQYRGVDLKVHKAKDFTRYTVYSLWDVFRANMPLYTILEPSRMNDFIKTSLEMYKKRNRLARWEIWGNYSGSMIGHHSLPMILDAYQKGIRDYDVELAYKAMKNEVADLGNYTTYGFIPADKEGGSVSKVMEYAYNDWCLAEMARLLGKKQDFLLYQQRAQFYKNQFNQEIGFMAPKNTDRSWVTPFDPTEGTEHFVEGNSYQYSLFAPHDVNGLIKLIGGDKAFIKWMDTMFTTTSKHDEHAVDATGLIGQYAHGNEPSHHMAYLYNYAGAAYKTQAIVREILDTMYDDQPYGMEGNEDCGQMSAWYILSAMGFYSVNPGDATYIIGSPLFEQVTVHLENGKDFIVRAENISSENKYIQSVALNGESFTKSWFNHSVIANGGQFVFQMGAKPNKSWGTSKLDRPLSQEFLPATAVPYLRTDKRYFLETSEIKLFCDTENAKIYYTLDGSEPTAQSTLYKGPFKINKTSTVRFMAAKQGLLNSMSVAETITKLDYEPFTSYTGKDLKPGLEYQYIEAEVMFAKELLKAKPIKAGITRNFNIKNRRRDENFGYIYTGYLAIPKDGIYTIYNKTNDGSILYMDDKEFINTDGGHPAYEVSRTVALKKGNYKISQQYFQMAGGFSNQVSWQGPGIPKQEIPASALFHTK